MPLVGAEQQTTYVHAKSKLGRSCKTPNHKVTDAVTDTHRWHEISQCLGSLALRDPRRLSRDRGQDRGVHVRDRDETEAFEISSEARPSRGATAPRGGLETEASRPRPQRPRPHPWLSQTRNNNSCVPNC